MTGISTVASIFSFILSWWLIGLLALEFLVKVGLNPVHQLDIVQNHSRFEELSDRTRSSALSVAGLVVAGLAIILSSNPGQLAHQVEMFGVALGLLLIAAFAHEMTGDYQFVLTFQELAFEYGLLIMLFGLYLLVEELVPAATGSMLAVFIIIFIFRFLSVHGEIQAHRNEFKNSGYETRRIFIQSWASQRNSFKRVIGLTRRNPATLGFITLIFTVYFGQLYLVGSTASSAAFTVIPNLPSGVYVAMAPWLHSSHSHILWNALFFAMLGYWAERWVGSPQFIIGAAAAGYLTNLVPSMIGFGGLGVGASGLTNALWGLFTFTQITLFYYVTQEDDVDYRMVVYRLSLFTVGLLFILKSVGEFLGYLTPIEDSASGAHLFGVVLGGVWFLYHYGRPRVLDWFGSRQVKPQG